MSLRAELQSAGTVKSFHRRWISPITASLALVSLTTALLWLVEARLKQDHLIFIYFVPTTLIAIRYGSIPTICVTIVSSFAAAYFLYPPQFSFLVASKLDLLELALFIVLAMLASQVVSGFANDKEVAKRNRWASAASFRRKWRL